VGSKLSSDPVWLDTAIGYTKDVFTVAQNLRDRHWLVRPFIYAFSDSRKQLWIRTNTARKLLTPLLKERAQQSPDDAPDDLLKWMTESARGADKTADRLTDKILFLCLASIHTSTSTAVHALYDLCEYQKQILPALKEEISAVKKQYGGLTLQALNKMKKLDSFLKESQRLNHPGTRTVVHSQITYGSIR
jgi:cytochrome P450